MANYAPTTWATGDTISATKLNNAENGLNNLTIAGTANQVLVNGATAAVNNAAITLTLPQSIGTGSSPAFASVTTAGVVFSASGNVAPNTSDASDNAAIQFCGGGDASTSRGGRLIVYGNEHASTGSIELRSGQVAGAEIRFYRGSDSALAITVDNNGNLDFASMQAAAPATNVSLNGSGQLQQDTSSIRFKEHVCDMAEWRFMLANLKPRSFWWRENIHVDDVYRHDFGFIAEEAAAVDARIASYSEGEVQSVRYQLLVAPLVAGWQDHEARIAALEARCA